MTDLHTLAVELKEAQADLALFQRLTSAEERVQRLTRDHEKAKAAHDRDEAKKAQAAHRDRFKGLSNIRIAVMGKPEASLTHKSFVITWTAPAFDAWKGAYEKRHTCNGFAALPPKVLAYLIEGQPQQIPAEVMALAPGDPAAAIDTYLAGIRRGHFNGKVPA